jgi:hypothetical protein
VIRSAVLGVLVLGGMLAVGVSVAIERLRWAGHVRCDVCEERHVMRGCYVDGWRFIIPERGSPHWRCAACAHLAPERWVA